MQRKDLVILLVLVLAVVAILHGESPVAGPLNIQTVTVTYCTPNGIPLAMDISSAVGQPPNSPTILLIHGGGLYSGQRSDMVTWTDALVPAGFITASIDYRLGPTYAYPDQIEDVKCAARFLRANAATYGINPNEIGAYGLSAGGYLSLILGTTGNTSEFDVGQWLSYPSQVEAVGDNSGPANLTSLESDSVAAGFWRLGGFMITATGVPLYTQHPNLTAAELASPTYYASKNSAPTLILQGVNDTTVPAAQAVEMYNTLTAYGDSTELVMMNDAGHGLSALFPCYPPTLLYMLSNNMTLPYNPDTTLLITEFFQEYLMGSVPVQSTLWSSTLTKTTTFTVTTHVSSTISAVATIQTTTKTFAVYTITTSIASSTQVCTLTYTNTNTQTTTTK